MTMLQLRREARRLYPGASRKMRARWVVAKLHADLRVAFRYPIGTRYVDRREVDFVRCLPRDGPALEVPQSLLRRLFA